MNDLPSRSPRRPGPAAPLLTALLAALLTALLASGCSDQEAEQRHSQEVEQLKAQSAELERQLDKAQTDIRQYRKMVEQDRAALVEAHADADRRHQGLRGMVGGLQDGSLQAEQFNGPERDLADQVMQLLRKIGQLQADLDSQRRAAVILDGLIGDLRSNNATLQRENDILRAGGDPTTQPDERSPATQPDLLGTLPNPVAPATQPDRP
ncbi:MAG: hypothetical protein BIFFINMI_02417 [Phycisphaerae bacterium]|nr:hypothetical protein [Phycisphaerae bacterium]